jgi:hypothetical protein
MLYPHIQRLIHISMTYPYFQVLRCTCLWFTKILGSAYVILRYRSRKEYWLFPITMTFSSSSSSGTNSGILSTSLPSLSLSALRISPIKRGLLWLLVITFPSGESGVSSWIISEADSCEFACGLTFQQIQTKLVLALPCDSPSFSSALLKITMHQIWCSVMGRFLPGAALVAHSPLHLWKNYLVTSLHSFLSSSSNLSCNTHTKQWC